MSEELEQLIADICRRYGLDGAVLIAFLPNVKRAEVWAASKAGVELKEKVVDVLEQFSDGDGMPLGRHGDTV